MMKLIQLVLAAVLLIASPCLIADKPDPNVPNPPLQVLEYNVDSNGWIAVHEQGTADVSILSSTELDVNVTNDTLDVSGSTVEVSNFPDPQNVTVQGVVDTSIAPANAAEIPNISVDSGESQTIDFATVNATTIVIWDNSVTGDNDPEFQLSIRSPLTGGGRLFKYAYDEGLKSIDVRSFTHPIPVSGIEIWCKNESLACTVDVAIIGY
jgi:hypothetical protein